MNNILTLIFDFIANNLLTTIFSFIVCLGITWIYNINMEIVNLIEDFRIKLPNFKNEAATIKSGSFDITDITNQNVTMNEEYLNDFINKLNNIKFSYVVLFRHDYKSLRNNLNRLYKEQDSKFFVASCNKFFNNGIYKYKFFDILKSKF